MPFLLLCSERPSLCALIVLSGSLFASGCQTRFASEVRSETGAQKVWTITADSVTPVQVGQDVWQELAFTSFGNVKTYLGIMNAMDTDSPEVHFIDTRLPDFQPERAKTVSQYGTHAVYSFTAGWVNSDHLFLRFLMGAKRIIFPFTLYDFSDSPIEINGQRISFVFQNRRYKFIDKAVIFSAAINKAFRTIQNTVYDGRPGAVIAYADDSDKRPNFDTDQGKVDIPALLSHGLSVHRITEMISAAGAETLSVLNPGVAFGELTLVKGDGSGLSEQPVFDEDGHFVEPDFLEDTGAFDLTSVLSPRHIAVFEEVPDRVPPVGGIITLEGQTPLSHVNLLAVNRGTPNASTVLGLSSIPGFNPELVGKLVKFTASEGGQARLEAADPDEAEAWFSRERPRLSVPIPQAKGSLELIELARAGAEQAGVEDVGAKSANYGKIERLLKSEGVVQPGFASGFDLYLALVDKAGIRNRLIDPLLTEKDRLSAREINARLAQIRSAIKEAVQQATVELNGENLVKAFTEQIRALFKGPYKGVSKIRLRSSTNSEDLPQFNGAGLYTSTGFKKKRTDGELRTKLGEVLSSLWLARAFWEREFFNVDHSHVAIGLQINPAFTDEIANGVIVFSREKNGDRYWINSQAGEASVTNPQNGELPESFTVMEEDTATLDVQSRSNIGSVFLDQRSKLVSGSRAAVLSQLMMVTKKISQFMIAEQEKIDPNTRYGVDIEYKIMPSEKSEGNQDQESLFVKQARLLHLGKKN